MADHEEPSGPQISRAQQRTARDEARQRRLRLGIGVGVVVAVALVVVLVLLFKGGGPAPTTTTTSSSTTTSTTTTTEAPVVENAVMPLTGVPVDGTDPAVGARLISPALAVKIDNAPEAQPQVGIEAADMVIEVMVEGISRYIAVFHSDVPEQIGPVRSARTSDPDLLAMFGKPVFAWSGGNANVTKVIRSTPWLVNASHDNRSADYFRERGRRAPHNLVIRARDLLNATAGEGSPPRQLFQYLRAGEETPGAPVAGFNVSVGSVHASFRWDAEAGRWNRFIGEHQQMAASGAPVAATNVVVAQTQYRSSPADRRSPEAESLGDGAVWVFTQGRMIPGRWQRATREVAWGLVDEAGAPILLAPGNTWVALPAAPQGPQAF